MNAFKTLFVEAKSPSLAVTPRSLDHQAADVIRQQILSGSFPPGHRLIETQLAEALDLSRGTVRSALQQLTYENLVLQLPYKGWLVPPLRSQDAWELYTLRSGLEGLAARLAASAITPEKAILLNQSFQQLVDAAQRGDRHAVNEFDFAIHKTIIQLTEHRRLQEQYKIIEQQIQLYITACNTLLEFDLSEIADQHQLMVQAICCGDAALAQQIAQNHSTADGETLVKYLQESEAKSSK
jgi:DNA-binding GntR family transcriptional regulator